MRKFSHMMIAILAYLLLGSNSCDSNKKESSIKADAELTKAVEDLNHEFKSDALSEKSRNAFEVKAKQKLVDFADYLNIYSVKVMDESFRNQARRMIIDLFVSDTVRINKVFPDKLNEKNIRLSEFLNSTVGFNSLNFNFDSIKIARPLQRTDEFNYAGSLKFRQHLKIVTSTDTLTTAPVRMEVDVIVSKIKKSFGNDTLQIWNVSLGSIH